MITVLNKDDGTVCCIGVDVSEKFWQYMGMEVVSTW